MADDRLFEVEKYGVVSYSNLPNACFLFRRERDKINLLAINETARVWFQSGAGKSLLWVERIK